MVNDVILKDSRRICERVNLDGIQGKSILVTGASGLIGTYILACLLFMQKELNVKIDVHAQMLSGPPPHTSELVAGGGFVTHRINFAETDSIVKNVPDADLIIHAAGYAQPTLFTSDPNATIQINTTATTMLLKKLRPNGKFLFISSSEIYNGLKKPFFAETDIGTTAPSHPRACYIEGKRRGETICNTFRSQGIDAKSARVGVVYGPGTKKNDKRALNVFVEKALCQRKIELLDSGSAIREYCYISDMVEMLWQILLHGKEPVYNVGGRSVIAIADLALRIAQITNAEVVFPETQKKMAGAPEEVHLDLTKMETEFGKRAYIGLDEGLKATIEWQKNLYL